MEAGEEGEDGLVIAKLLPAVLGKDLPIAVSSDRAG